MSQSTFNATTHFNLGRDLNGAIMQGIIALILHFGENNNNFLRLSAAMRACRSDFGRYGNFGSYVTNRRNIDTTIGKELLLGVYHVLKRFGDTADTRTKINEVFEALEAEWDRDGYHLPRTDDYSKVSSANLQSYVRDAGIPHHTEIVALPYRFFETCSSRFERSLDSQQLSPYKEHQCRRAKPRSTYNVAQNLGNMLTISSVG